MKITFNKRTIVTISLIILTGIIIAILIVSFKGREDVFLNTSACSSNNIGNFVPAALGTTETPELEWKMNIMQPIVVDYISIDSINFVVVEITADNGDCMKLNLALGGDFMIEDQSGLTKDFTTTYVDGERLDYQEIKTKIKPGTQISVKYLSAIPADEVLNDDVCQTNKTSQYYCAMQKVNEDFFGYSPRFLGYTAEDISEGNKIYINEITTQIIDVPTSE
jgi:hypothetical protein